MHKILSIILVTLISCRFNTDSAILYNKKDQVIFSFEKNTMQVFLNSFHVPIQYLANGNNLYCGESIVFGCYDINRKSFDVCIGYYQLLNDQYKLTLSDSCVQNVSYLLKPLHKINLTENAIIWDSITIEYKDYINEKYVIPFSDSNFKAINHPFTINQEVRFMITERFNLATSATSDENQIEVNVYYGPKVISQMKGNLVIPIFKSIFTRTIKSK